MSSTSALSRDECRKIVNRYLRRDDFELAWFALAPLSTDMKGFMGDHLKLRISVTLGDKDGRGTRTIEMQFFVKSVPLDDGYRRNFAMASVAYQKEVLFYGDLLQEVRRHLRCPDYESSTYLATVPQCYYLRPDLLVLEDLALSGFRMLDPMKPLDIQECECVLKALARLHATSLVLEEREGQRLVDKYPLLTQETLYRNEPGAQHYFAQAATRSATHVLLDLVPRFAPGTPHNQELHNLLDTVMESIYELLKSSDKGYWIAYVLPSTTQFWRKLVHHSRSLQFTIGMKRKTSRWSDVELKFLLEKGHVFWCSVQFVFPVMSGWRSNRLIRYRNVLCHRDLWVNNMLFGEDAKGELSVRLVDFQTLHLEPPANDVVPFMHLVMTRDVRNAHSQRLLELYHQTLADVLRQHDLDVDSILPLRVFLQSCEETKPMAVVLAVYVLQFTMLPQQKDMDLESFVLQRKDLVKATYQNDERYRLRMTQAIEDLVETCLMPHLREQHR